MTIYCSWHDVVSSCLLCVCVHVCVYVCEIKHTYTDIQVRFLIELLWIVYWHFPLLLLHYMRQPGRKIYNLIFHKD